MPNVPSPRRSLLAALLLWAVLPMPEHDEALRPSEASAEAVLPAAAEQEPACGPRVTCLPSILVQQATTLFLDARASAARDPLRAESRTHVHQPGRDPPPPRLTA